MVKFAGRAGCKDMGVGGGFEMEFEPGVVDVGLGEASMDCTVGGPRLRGWVSR